MAANVNLLPPELAVSKGLAKASKTFQSLTLILVVVFLVFSLGIVAYFVISSFELRSLSSREESLKESIKQMEETEQKLVLLKDRIGKIKITRSSESSIPNLDGINPVLSNITTGSSVSELAVDPTKVDTSIIFTSSSQLGSFLKSLPTSVSFKSAVLTSFGFNPSTGYLVGIRFK